MPANQGEEKMMKTAVILLGVAAALTAGPTYLIRVDLGPNQTVTTLANLGIPVIQESKSAEQAQSKSAEQAQSKSASPRAQLSNYCLAKVSEPDMGRLTRNGYAVQILAQDPQTKLLVFAMPIKGSDRPRLSNYGTILTEDENGVLMLIEESALLELNRLPVQLSRLSMEPMKFGPDPDPPATIPVDDSLVQALVDRVNPDSVLAHIRRLQNFYTRYSTTDSCRAAVQWVENKFSAYGCDSTGLETYRSNYAPNVIGAKFGTVNRRPIWVICGHTDNTSDYAPNRCPGSDDNASGTAAVLEACRVFQGINFDNTVYFIAFTGEEQGLYGSDSFCSRASRRGDSIKAALNFDMISYGRQNIDTIEIIGKTANPACAWLVDSFIANARRYTTLKTHRTIQTNPPANSDHASFLRRGWPALCAIENDFTPEYHTIGDTIGPLYYRNCGTNNWLMATEAIKAAVATIAKFAGAHLPVSIKEQPTVPVWPELVSVTPTVGPAPVRLTLSAPLGAHARLQIYDATGRTRRTIAEPADRTNWSWDGRDGLGRPVGPGVYLLHLSSGPRTVTARVVLTN